MESTSSSTPTLAILIIDHLRHYKPQNEDDDHEEEAAVDGDDDLGLGAESTAWPGPFRPKRAAVLICLFEDERAQIRVILTMRSSTLSTHSGEVSLPGGKAEEGDADERETAGEKRKRRLGWILLLLQLLLFLNPSGLSIFFEYFLWSAYSLTEKHSHLFQILLKSKQYLKHH